MSTRHTQIRQQQRGIPPLVVDLLLQFGASEKSHDGTRKLFFDKTARRRVQSYAGPLARLLGDHLDVFAVIGNNDAVVTTGHLYERVRRH